MLTKEEIAGLEYVKKFSEWVKSGAPYAVPVHLMDHFDDPGNEYVVFMIWRAGYDTGLNQKLANKRAARKGKPHGNA